MRSAMPKRRRCDCDEAIGDDERFCRRVVGHGAGEVKGLTT
jgi:hypothetical protein